MIIATRNRVNNIFNNLKFNGDTNNLSPFPSTNKVTGDIKSGEKPAQIRRNQRSLWVLLNEFEYKVGSEKPAKLYDSRDRGANRYLYTKQNQFLGMQIKQ